MHSGFNYQWLCSACQRTYQPGQPTVEWEQKCQFCSSRLDLETPHFPRWDSCVTDLPGLWRYLRLVPTSETSAKLLLSFDTPEFAVPIASKSLAEHLKVNSVFLLPCTTGPSGTFKDSEAAVVIAKCLDWGWNNKILCWHSTGNTARAYREYALRAGITNSSFFPLDCLYKWKGAATDRRGSLRAYDGVFQELSSVAKKHAETIGAQYLAPLVWKVEGKACIAYVIAEHVPDATCIVQTIAGGYGALGMALGFTRLNKTGLLKNTGIRFSLFQIEGADTISRLLPLGRDITQTDLVLPKNPFEPTLQSTNPLSTFRLIRSLVEDTKSTVSSVSPAEVEAEAGAFLSACRELGVALSYEYERSPFISWAGLVRAATVGHLRPSENIVIVVTGCPPRYGFIPEIEDVVRP